MFTWATEQVIREIYARPFERALKDGNSTGVMGSFNRIGNINSQLNGAVKSLVRDEWDNRAIFETDAWQGTYCPVDLMVRQGNNQLLGSGSTIPDVGLEVGTWDPELNCVQVSNGGDGTFPSYTHYAAVRKSAQEILWNYSNGNGIKNGYTTIDAAVLEFDAYAVESLPIEFAGIDYLSVALTEESVLPEGFTLENGIVTADGSHSEGEWTVDVSLTGIDGYINMTAPVIIRIVDPIHVSGAESLRVGEAAEIEIDAPYYAYDGVVTMNPAYTNTLCDLDGNGIAAPQDATEESEGQYTGDGISGNFRILNWYWEDEAQLPGNGYDAIGHLSFADIEATDARYMDVAEIEAGNYYKAFQYGYSISEEDIAALGEYGLTVENVMTEHAGTQGVSYDVNTSLRIAGTPTQAGSAEVTVTLQVPLVRGLGGSCVFPNFNALTSPVVTELTRTITIDIAE